MKTLKNILGVGTIILALAGCGNNTKLEKSTQNSPLESQTGINIITREGRSLEVLSDYQLKRLHEWYSRFYHFNRCDKNKDGVLRGKEKKEYESLPIFNYRFR